MATKTIFRNENYDCDHTHDLHPRTNTSGGTFATKAEAVAAAKKFCKNTPGGHEREVRVFSGTEAQPWKKCVAEVESKRVIF